MRRHHFVQIARGVVRVRHPRVHCTFMDTPTNWARFIRAVQELGDGPTDESGG